MGMAMKSHSSHHPRPYFLMALVAAIVLLLSFHAFPAAKKDNLPRLTGAKLLLGWPPFGLTLTTVDQTSTLQQDEQSDWYVTPSISADGRIIASAHPLPGEPPRSRSLMVSTWSAADQRWTDYNNLEIAGGAVAISPDGSKLACVTRWRTDAPSRLEILDRKTGKLTIGPEILESAGTDITWSPHSRRLAFDIGDNRSPVKEGPTSFRAIYVMNVETGAFASIGEGVAPSWSPSGEWIAFLDYFPDQDDPRLGPAAARPNRVSLMRPDGTGARILFTFHSDEALMVPPVWSPDSGTLLINRFRDKDKATMDIDALDLATLQLTRKFKNTPPVYAWRTTQ
jgi:dipeptidyl aminopeptidase/acylaminoacyl peptidase